MTTSSKVILGIAGTFASGQDTLGKYFASEYNFYFRATGDLVRAQAEIRKGSVERPVLQAVARELRFEQGAGALVKIAIDEFEKTDKLGVAIGGIRSLGEANEIKNSGGCIVFTDAPIEIRYERMKNRARDGESVISLEEFQKREEFEFYQGDGPEEFNRRDIEKMADFRIDNSENLESFLAEADAIAQKLGLTKRTA